MGFFCSNADMLHAFCRLYTSVDNASSSSEKRVNHVVYTNNKYIYKGYDRATIQVDIEKDEVA